MGSSRAHPSPRFAHTVAVEGRRVQEVADRVSRSASPHSVSLRSPALHGSMTFGSVGAVDLVHVRYGADVVLDVAATPDRTTITVPFGPMRLGRPGQRSGASPPRTDAFVVDQHEPSLMEPDPDAGALVISTTAAVLDDHLRELLRGRAEPGGLRFLSAGEPGPPAPAPLLLTHAWTVAQALGATEACAPATVRREVERFLLDAFVLGLPHTQSGLLAAPGHDPRADLADLARQHIVDHHRAPLSVVQVAHAVGVSVRQLEYVVARRFEATPRELLQAVRIEDAHELLARAAGLAPEQRPSVASIALTAGFTHLGRFAALYRHRYGRTPRAALRDGAHVC